MTDAVPDDPLNLDNLRMPQNFAETAGVKKILRTVPVRKPNKQDFVRVHPDPNYRADLPLIVLKEDREEYVVTQALVPDLLGEVAFMTIFTAVNRQGVAFLWPVPLPSADGRHNEWHRSQREAAELAMTTWLRVKANMSLGAYEIVAAETIRAEPAWPDVSFQELIRLAFRDRVITSFDHPVIKRLNGR
jgi:hypothetical protein